MKLQGVIFDLDGVITDTAHLHFQAWQQIAAEIGISIDAQFNEFLKGISRDESLRRILQHGGKEGDFNPQERAQLAYRKNLLYVHSLRELTVNAVLPEATLFNIAVDPDYQRQGLGRALLEHLIDELEKRGVATLWLEVRASNAAAIALYESLGFNEATIRRNYYPTTDGREDAIIMALPISM